MDWKKLEQELGTEGLKARLRREFEEWTSKGGVAPFAGLFQGMREARESIAEPAAQLLLSSRTAPQADAEPPSAPASPGTSGISVFKDEVGWSWVASWNGQTWKGRSCWPGRTQARFEAKARIALEKIEAELKAEDPSWKGVPYGWTP